MKFRLKVTFLMILLLSLLFSVGGSALISISFHSSLQREKTSAQESYRILLSTLQVVNQAGAWSNSRDISKLLEQLSQQSSTTWSALKLFTPSEIIYQQGAAANSFADLHEQTDTEHCVLTAFTDENQTRHLLITGAFRFGPKTFYLATSYDISPIYEVRSQQQSTYNKIFVILIVVCSLLAYSAAYFLTRPLDRLSKASREIAAGNFHFRAKIKSNDEIGLLAQDFDAMAEQVECSISELKAAMERQKQFAESFTHELKTPLTAIIGYADLLRGRTLLPEEQSDAAHYIFSEGKRLERLSLKLLDIYIADNQPIAMTLNPPAGIIADLTTHLSPSLRKENILLKQECEPGTCLMEPDLVRSLLLNLIDNSRKAFDHGGVITIASVMTQEGCRITVSDNGKGIPQDALEHLTEAFYRVDKSRSRAQGGAGLGLTLCLKIAELHHGGIRFESDGKQGTAVTVELNGGKS